MDSKAIHLAVFSHGAKCFVDTFSVYFFIAFSFQKLISER